MDVDEIELVYLERVEYSLKNFDMVFIYKDYATFKRINSIPMESLDTIKSWLDSVDILFFEGRHPMNWSNLLSTIREDIEGFVTGGGWKFLD
jgi:nucleosome binding factor SPN SPT16 subunit